MTMNVQARTKTEKKPFGYATCVSRTEKGRYPMTGGGEYKFPIKGKHVTLTSTGRAMDDEILSAIQQHDIVVFDGQKGDFIVSIALRLNNLKNKTLMGMNGATLRTEWQLTDSLRAMLDEEGIQRMSTSANTGGVLPSGQKISEEAEYHTRRLLSQKYGNEHYRQAGLLVLNGCENIIIRHLNFEGPGSVDVGGCDLLTLNRSKHVWVDHCDFVDGLDGNFDITTASDFVTVSYCHFHYTERSYMHQNSNLVGSSDREERGHLNITFAYNHWGKGCRGRMPMARVGRVHLLGNYYDPENNVAPCVNPRADAEFLIEGNRFAPCVTRVYSNNGAKKVEWRSSNLIENEKVGTPHSTGKVSVPYRYVIPR